MHNSLFNLKGRVALITGGSKGLGKAMARGFVEAGADVIISSRHENELRAALAEILKGSDRQGRFIVADMSQRSEADRLGREAPALFGHIHVPVNNPRT